MKQVVQNIRSGALSVDDVPAPRVRAGGVLVAVRRSLISSGTERSTVNMAKKSLAGKAAARPDLVRKVVDKARKDGLAETVRMVSSRLDAPAALGYSCAGVVVEAGAGVADFRAGDRVACAGQDYASHAEYVFVPKNLTARLPEAVSFDHGAYVTLGAIAMQGVRQAGPRLGERVGVIGLGLLGQLTVQLLKANGCYVVASDPMADRIALARNSGADQAVAPDDLAAAVDGATGGLGLDAVIVTASTRDNAPIEAAAEIARQKGRVVVVGAVGMNLPREPFYRKELDLRLSMSYGPGRYDENYEAKGHDYPFAYVRWTEQRNMAAFLDLVAEGKVDVERLTSHRFAIDRATEAYDLIAGGAEPSIGVLLEYPEPSPAIESRAVVLSPQANKPIDGDLRIGLVGAGNHTRDMLLPALAKVDGAAVHAICTQRGLNAKALARRVGAALCTTDPAEIFDDPEIHAVIVATRHDSHAALVRAALAAGKNVFVEKPLCLTMAELDEIRIACREASLAGRQLVVGYNRRFSAHTEKIAEALAGRRAPLVMCYRVNAGALPADHWTQDPEAGGGRIIGEACHFIDYLHFICGAAPTSVHATCARGADGGALEDQAIVTLTFADGSIGTVIYAAGGDKAMAKERCEILGDGRSIVLDDFARTEIHSGGKRSVFKTRTRDKGFRREMASFVAAVREGEALMPFGSIDAVMRATLLAVESFRDQTVKRIEASDLPARAPE